MTSTFPDISLHTDRLVLRPFEAEDLRLLGELGADESVRAWLPAPFPGSGGDAAADAPDWALRRAPERRESGEGAVFAVVEVTTGGLVGFVEVTAVDWRLRTAGAEFAVGPWARGEGYASEAVAAVAQWLFEDQKFERLELRTAADNIAAQQVAQKVGCISEGVLRSASLVRVGGRSGGGESRTDVIVWGLLPEDLDGLWD